MLNSPSSLLSQKHANPFSHSISSAFLQTDKIFIWWIFINILCRKFLWRNLHVYLSHQTFSWEAFYTFSILVIIVLFLCEVKQSRSMEELKVATREKGSNPVSNFQIFLDLAIWDFFHNFRAIFRPLSIYKDELPKKALFTVRPNSAPKIYQKCSLAVWSHLPIH